MDKKLITACMTIAAFAAFIVAPAASAATLTESGSAIAVGSSITASAGETKFTAGTSTVTCSSGHMTGNITADANGTVAGEIPAGNPSFTGTGSGGDCTSSNLGPVKPFVNSKLCLHIAKGTDTGNIVGCAGAVVTFTLNVTNLGLACKYESASVSGSITTSPSDAAINLSEQEVGGESTNNFFCPASGKLDMEFTLTTTDGTTLIFS